MTKKEKFLWLLHRAAAMSPREIIYRVGQRAERRQLKIKYGEEKSVLSLFPGDVESSRLEGITRFAKVWDFESVQCLLSPFKYKVFDSEIDLSLPIFWHGQRDNPFDKSAFSWEIEFKGQDDKGEIRKVWELNRMQFLPYMVLYALKNDDCKVLERARELFYDWVLENPFLRGVNWASSMETAIRAYQWTAACSVLAYCNREPDFQRDLLKGAIVSIEYVMSHLSAFSSANNHLIVEAALSGIIGLFMEEIYPQDWYSKSANILKREFPRQFYSDGVNREHALHYHAFVTDAWLQYNTVSVQNSHAPVLFELMCRATEFLSRLQIGDFYADFGDSDDAHILRWIPSGKSYYKEILDMAEDGGRPSVWRLVSWPRHSVLRKEKYQWYEESGYFVYNDDEWLFLFDAAELGFGKLAAHGHADCLQVLLYNKDFSVLTDRGTYIYNIEKGERDHFRATQAHNTVAYDGKSQSQMLGPFIWGKRARVRSKTLQCDDEAITLTASHNGYAPHTHKRAIKFFMKNGRLFKIEIHDVFSAQGQAYFHFDEVKPTLLDERALLIHGTARFSFSRSFVLKECSHSAAFMEKSIAYAACLNFQGSFITTIDFKPLNCLENSHSAPFR